MSDQRNLWEEVYRHTERRLDAQLSAEVSRDQRALVVVAFSIASAGFSLRAAESSGVGAFVGAAVAFAMASLIGALSALPREFHGSGYRFATLRQTAEEIEDYVSFLASMAAKNDEYIDRNERASVVMMNLYRLSIVFFCFGALLGLVGLISLGGAGI